MLLLYYVTSLFLVLSSAHWYLWFSCLHWPLPCPSAFLSQFHQIPITRDNLKAPSEILPLALPFYPSYDGWRYLRSSQPVHQALPLKRLEWPTFFSPLPSILPLSNFPSMPSLHSQATTTAAFCPLTFLSFTPFLPPTLFSHFNCPPEPRNPSCGEKTSFIRYFPDNLLFLSLFRSSFLFSPFCYRNSPFPYKMKIHLELHLMSSLCLLSVDDVYEQCWLAAECLMMHKIKPRLSAALWLPSGTHTAEACWEYKLQTAIRWKELTSLFFCLRDWDSECVFSVHNTALGMDFSLHTCKNYKGIVRYHRASL